MEKKSPLFEAEQALQAQFKDSFGWTMPDSFGDPLEEQQAVRTTAGLFDLTYHGAIRVAGGERIQFLNGLVTNDVKTLEDGKGMRAAFLTGHGKVRALARIFRRGEEFLIVTDPQTHEKVFSYIFPFSYAGDFQVQDVSSDYRLLSVQGPRAHLIMKEVSFEPLTQTEPNRIIETTIAGWNVLAVNNSHTGENGFDLFIASSGLKDVWDFLLVKGEFHSIRPAGLAALDALRIEAGIPIYGVDADETNMMLELGLADAVSFNKGCYTGQEAVAMATYRGHVSKKLSGLAVAGDFVPAPKSKLFKGDKEIGFVTSATRSHTLGGVVALGYVKYGFFDPGTALEIRSENEVAPATVVELPFYRRG